MLLVISAMVDTVRKSPEKNVQKGSVTMEGREGM